MLAEVKDNAFIAHLLQKKKRREFKIDGDRLTRLIEGRVLLNEPLARYTTFKVGGPADALIFPAHGEDFRQVLQYAHAEQIPVFVLGNGSNVLVRQGGIRGIVVCLRECLNECEVLPANSAHEFLPEKLWKELQNELQEDDILVRVEAGFSVPKLLRQFANEGISGLEGLAGVVGSMGGALAMNAGTRHGVIGDTVLAIKAINRAGEDRVFTRKQLKFHYRHLDLDGAWYFLETVLRLKKVEADEVRSRMKEYLDYRQKTQPLNLPNAGSIFKNPPGEAAGKLIERNGLKGVRIRGAKVSELHGNWIVNLGDASSQDILQLIHLIKDKIKETEGIQLETEVKIIGE